MRRNTRRNTQPELLLRRALWRLGARYRLHFATLPGRPDLVFPSAKLAVFCDGDFWHGRGWQARRRRLARGANAAYWIPKILANRARDRRVSRQLTALGWRVARVWESEILRDPHVVALRLTRGARTSPPRR
jgi:DNA mismatch endonuclease (patch repair protein)